jgi:hypothetical protein
LEAEVSIETKQDRRSPNEIAKELRPIPLNKGMWDDAMYLQVQEEANKSAAIKLGGPKKVLTMSPR